MNELIDLANQIAAEADADDAAQRDDAARIHDELIELITASRFRLDLQSMHDVITGSALGAEALARFPGTMSPAEWFRVAHALDLGNDLELRVVHEVIERWATEGRGMVSVNVSPQVLTDPRLLDMLRSASGELMIEVTDQTSMPELSMVRCRLAEIRAMGIRVAVHVGEFGAEALRTLLLAEPDVVKLSPPLSAALAAGHIDPVQAENFFARCRHAGVFIVAVGVETHAQLELLEGLGVDGYQGFITRNVDIDPIPSW